MARIREVLSEDCEKSELSEGSRGGNDDHVSVVRVVSMVIGADVGGSSSASSKSAGDKARGRIATLDVRPARSDICSRSDGLCFCNAVAGSTFVHRWDHVKAKTNIPFPVDLLPAHPHPTTSPTPLPGTHPPALHSLHLDGMQGRMDHSTKHVRIMHHRLDQAAAQRDNPVPK